MFEDRRKQMRYPCLVTGEARPAGTAPFEVVCTSLSRGGAFFSCKKPLPPHSQLTVILRPQGPEGPAIECAAEVTWTSPRGGLTAPGFGVRLRSMNCAAGDQVLRAFAAEHMRWADLPPLPVDADGRAWLRWGADGQPSGLYSAEPVVKESGLHAAERVSKPVAAPAVAVIAPRSGSGAPIALGAEAAAPPQVAPAGAAASVRTPPAPAAAVAEVVPVAAPGHRRATGPRAVALDRATVSERAVSERAASERAASSDSATDHAAPAVLGWGLASPAVSVPTSGASAPFPSVTPARRPTPTVVGMQPDLALWERPAAPGRAHADDSRATQPNPALGMVDEGGPTVAVSAAVLQSIRASSVFAAPPNPVTVADPATLPPAGQPADTLRQPHQAAQSAPSRGAPVVAKDVPRRASTPVDQRPSAPRAVKQVESGVFFDDLPDRLAHGAESPAAPSPAPARSGRQSTHPGAGAPQPQALAVASLAAMMGPTAPTAAVQPVESPDWNDATNPELLISALADVARAAPPPVPALAPHPAPAGKAKPAAAGPAAGAAPHAPSAVPLDEHTYVYGRATGSAQVGPGQTSQSTPPPAVAPLSTAPALMRGQLQPVLESWPAGVPRSMSHRYNYLQILGQGGHGVVYRARDTMLERHVVLKLLVQSVLGTDVARRYFQREVKLAASLNHPNIVHIYDVGEAEGVLWYAMEFVDGVPLAQYLLPGQPLTDPGFLYSVFSQLCEALDHAHNQGILHRDVKPDNVLVASDGTVKLFDFGLARAADQGFGEYSLLLGTPHYMAPEQLTGGTITRATDIYALGVLLYRLVAGEVPFREGNVFAAHVLEPVPDPRRLVPGISAATVAVVMKLLAKKPEDRYADCRQAAIDLWPSLFSTGH